MTRLLLPRPGVLALALLLLIPLGAWAQDTRPTPEPEPPPIDAAAIDPVPLPRPAGESPRVPLEEIQRYVGVYRAVRDAYVDEVSDAELMQSAIRGLLTDLDPHSAYLDREQSQGMEEFSEGVYDGIGVELVQQPDRSLLVIAPIDDTPAFRAGIKPGDLIIAIDGEPVVVDSVDEAVTTLRGPPGSEVRLTVLREGVLEPLELVVVRETIRITSVRHRWLEPGFGYVRISVFQGDTARELRQALTALTAGEGEAALRGLVLDLRSNPGGLLHTAVEAADAFLDAAQLDNPVIVTTKGRLPFADGEYRAHSGDLSGGVPIVVLVDSGSASAAEVLAGALRDHRRALIMGERTFGKGSVQTIVPLDNGDSIKLTTARYYTPSGRSIQATGITPDIAVAERRLAQRLDRPPSLRERDLPGHLRGEDEHADAGPMPAAVDIQTDDDADPLIAEALNVLKGLAVLGHPPPGG